MVSNQSLKGLFRIVSQNCFIALVCGRWKHCMLMMPTNFQKIKKKSSVSRSPLQSTHSIYEIITDLGLNAMSLFMDWYRELPCLGSKPHWQYLTDTYTWLICFNLRQFCRIFLPCWQRESSPVSTRHENFCTQSRTMATKTHSFCYSLILEGSEDSDKRDKNHVQNTIQIRLVQHSLHKTWEVWEKKQIWHPKYPWVG